MPTYDEHQAREAVSSSLSYAEALRKLGLSPVGGNHRVFGRYVDEVWKISTDHFDSREAQRKGLQTKPLPMDEVLVESSTYSRASLKRRLFQAGLKEPVCELCGQGEIWRLIACAGRGEAFAPSRSRQRYCSRKCGCRHDNHRPGPTSFTRKVERPPYEQLIQETQALGFSAVGRKYGVSDNAVRKWIRWYEAAAERDWKLREDAA